MNLYLKEPAIVDGFANRFTSLIHEQLGLAEEKILREVLTEYLGREPTSEDAKECNKEFKQGDFSRYRLSHKGVTLGFVDRKWDGNTYYVTFTPQL